MRSDRGGGAQAAYERIQHPAEAFVKPSSTPPAKPSPGAPAEHLMRHQDNTAGTVFTWWGRWRA